MNLPAGLSPTHSQPPADYLRAVSAFPLSEHHDSSVEVSSRSLRMGHAAARIGRAVGATMLIAGLYGALSAKDSLAADRAAISEHVNTVDLRTIDTDLSTQLASGHMSGTTQLTSLTDRLMAQISSDIENAQTDAGQLSSGLETAGLGFLTSGASGLVAAGLKRRRSKKTLHFEENGTVPGYQVFTDANRSHTLRISESDTSPIVRLKRQSYETHKIFRAGELYVRGMLLGATAILAFGSPASEGPAQYADNALSTIMPTDFMQKALQPIEAKETHEYTAATSARVAGTVEAKLPKTEALLGVIPEAKARANQALVDQITAELKAADFQHDTTGVAYFSATQQSFEDAYSLTFEAHPRLWPGLLGGIALFVAGCQIAYRDPRMLGTNSVPMSIEYLFTNLERKNLA